MFALSALFAALSRLTASVNRSASIFEAANEQLARQLGLDAPADAPALDHRHDDNVADAAPAKPARNGRKVTA